MFERNERCDVKDAEKKQWRILVKLLLALRKKMKNQDVVALKEYERDERLNNE